MAANLMDKESKPMAANLFFCKSISSYLKWKNFRHYYDSDATATEMSRLISYCLNGTDVDIDVLRSFPDSNFARNHDDLFTDSRLWNYFSSNNSQSLVDYLEEYTLNSVLSTMFMLFSIEELFIVFIALMSAKYDLDYFWLNFPLDREYKSYILTFLCTMRTKFLKHIF